MPTNHLKVLVSFVLSVAELVESLAHGFSFSLIGKVVEIAKAAGPALGHAGAALGQYIAMDDAGAAELETFIKADFNLDDDKVEAAIETALAVAVQLHSLVALFVKKPVVQVPA